MKKLTVLVLVLTFISALVGCANRRDGTADTPELDEISDYTQEQLEEKLLGLSNEELHHLWGEPDGMLSGFWGDIWSLSDESKRQIIIYYDADGFVEHILVDERHSDSSSNLTLEKVRELSEKGEELSWSDFEQYPHEDIGSGLYIYRYDIDEHYYLLIGGGGPETTPAYLTLVSKADDSVSIDIRTEDVAEFINAPIQRGEIH